MHTILNRIPYSFFVTSLFIAGICWQFYLQPLWLLVLFVLLATLIYTLQNISCTQKAMLLSATVILFFLGAIRSQHQRNNFELFYETHLYGPYIIIGTIDAIEPADQSYCNTRISMHIDKIKTPAISNRWKKCTEKIFIYTYNPRNLHVADKILIRNITFKKSNNNSFNTFLMKEHAIATLFIPKLKHYLLDRPSFSVARGIEEFKISITNRLKQKISCATFKFFSAIFLGNPTEKRSLKEPKSAFKLWGVMHYLARSGLHLIFFVILLHLLLRFFSISFLQKQLLLIGIISLYSLLSWPSIPFSRAFYTFMLYKAAPFFKMRPHLLHILSCICLITLFNNPIQLFFLDFQLSFGITCALAYFNIYSEKNYQ